MPIRGSLFGITVPVFSAFAALCCTRLVEAPPRWIRARSAIGADTHIDAGRPGPPGTLTGSRSPMGGDGLSTGLSASAICELGFADGWLDA